ncbi:ABC transporter ATP-binding protein [Aquicoccus porphyridii]|uniref:ABC transporter ATP-binding protein n=1 Tax=Aquicoccus porphyridii TaxID=1852029 RepID=A0A5A9YYW3_9RHOB|nr:ABC transporter ATP-binding protein [Aquicoccus porphyridii]RAI52142.1 ABC transporter ATP-binding protein [Rhodobacteraceae bacterium AsT-22]
MIERIELATPDRRAGSKLNLEGLTKTFGAGAEAVQALAPTDIAVTEGEFLAIVGPSGCGKTTLLNIVAGFETPSGGCAVLDGRPIEGPGSERGVVFQQGALFNWMSVLENVAFGPRACGVAPDAARESAQAMLEKVGLGGFVENYPYQLSGGMQQRVGIARALVNDPAILLMDEPFAALDQQTRELLQEEVRGMWRETGKTVLWITHSIEEALFLASHIVVMTARPGRVKAAFRCRFSESPDLLVASTPEFTAAKREILGLLRSESEAAQRQESMI